MEAVMDKFINPFKTAVLGKERKVIQIAGDNEAIIALCSDGTIWQLTGGLWYKTPDIPGGA